MNGGIITEGYRQQFFVCDGDTISQIYSRVIDAKTGMEVVDPVIVDCCQAVGVGFNVADVIGSDNTEWNINGTDSDAVDDVPTGWTIDDLVADLNASDPLGGTWVASSDGASAVLTSADTGYIHLKFVSLVPVITIPFGPVAI